MGFREDKLARLIKAAVETFFGEELPWLGFELNSVERSDAGVVKKRISSLIKLMLLRDPGLERYSRCRGPLLRVEWQCDEILGRRWRPHNRLKEAHRKRREP